MPQYTFLCPACKKQTVIIRPMSDEEPILCKEDGFVMVRDFKADFGKQFHGDTYPYSGSAAGLHPDDVAYQMKQDKISGVPTHYTDDGDPIYTSKSHRKKYLESRGIFDRNAGFSDPVPARCR